MAIKPTDGEAIFIIVNMIDDPSSSPGTTLELPDSPLGGCCDDQLLNVLASTDDESYYKNDRCGIIGFYDAIVYNAAVITLQKMVNGEYVDAKTLDDNTYGTFYPFKFKINKFNKGIIWYLVEWKLILRDVDLGEGQYRFKKVASSGIFGSLTEYSQEYCLQEYTAERADGTVRLEYNMNGVVGAEDANLAYDMRDFIQIDYFNSYRVQGYLTQGKPEYINETSRNNNGLRPNIKAEQEPNYILQLIAQPFHLLEVFRIDILMSDFFRVTDYNSVNAKKNWLVKHLQNPQGYESDFDQMNDTVGGVKVELREAVNNLKRFRK